MQQDTRQRYITTRLGDFFGTEPKFGSSVVENFLSNDNNVHIINDFLKGEGAPPHLYFTYERLSTEEAEQTGQSHQLCVATKASKNLELKGKVVYFIRNTDKSVSLKDADMVQDVIVGAIDGPNVIQYFEHLLTYVYQPVFNKQTNWGKANDDQREEFVGYVNKFIETLGELIQSQPDSVELLVPDPRFLDNLPGEHDTVALTKAGNDPKLVQYLETAIIEQWCQVSDRLLSEKDDSSTTEPQNIQEEVGPITELEYWKLRFQKLDTVLQQLQSKPCRMVLAILGSGNQRASKPFKKWKEKEALLHEAANEAKDNLKYLATLEKYMEPLYNGTPQQIMDILPGLVNTIKMMFIIAKHYSTSDRMATLFIKITNQMIVNCKQTIKGGGRLWDQNEEGELETLLSNLKSCIKLNQIYQEEYYKCKEKLSLQSKGQQFDFNELHIFGKFELFCKRIQKLIDVFTTIQQFTSLSNHNIDGMDSLIKRFFEIVDDLKRKGADLLDYTKPSFDKDYIEFNKMIQELESSLQVFINSSFENITSTENALALLKKFQSILQRDNLKSDLDSKYMVIFHNYGLDLENVQKTYERHKANPPMLRNSPTIAGKVTWARQLLRRIEEPMKQFQQNKVIMSNQKESRKIFKTYNRVARALIEFETLWLNAWTKSINSVRDGLKATLIVRQTGKLYVNFDPEILQLVKETKWLQRMGIQVPDAALTVLMQEEKFKRYNAELTYTLKEYERIFGKMIPITKNLMQRSVDEVDSLIRPGETVLTWTSMNIDQYLGNIQKGLTKLEELVTKVNDVVENRVQSNLKLISKTLLVNLPESQSFSLEQFVSLQEKLIKQQAHFMNIKNNEVEKAVNDVIATILAQQGTSPDEISFEMKEEIHKLKVHYNRLMFKAILTTTTKSLNLIKKRVGTRNRKGFMFVDRPFFDVNVELHSKAVILNPSLDEVQDAINRSATAVLKCSKYIGAWKDMESSVGFFDEIARNKEIVKVVLLLTGGIHGLKKQVMDYLNSFKRYEYLWTMDKQEAYEQFLASNPTLEDFENELRKYMTVEQEISSITPCYTIGSLSLDTSHLKLALKNEAQLWKHQYARNLHQQAQRLMEKILFDMEENDRKLQTEITDNLQDLRVVMETLKDIRERESEIDLSFRPVEEMYQLLHRYDVHIAKDEIDRVSDLRYKWKKLRTVANETNDEISGHLQHKFKRDLIQSVQRFAVDVLAFRNDFEANGPMVENIKPQEAMERLKKYQRLFDDKARKWDTLLAGEKLFGLPEHDYPSLKKTEKELGLLEKLYTLYITVIQKINGYADLLWTELDFQAITDEVLVFQNQCKRMPKALRTWDAYFELRKTIEDFLALQPLLEQLSQNSLRERHWKEIMRLTGHSWRLDPDMFKMGNLLDANLLDHKEEIEDIALSSIKEVDIENKKNSIAAEWEDRELSFAEFKHRGPIILKGDETAQVKEQLEESQLALGSMLASRYVAPFREEVNGWLMKLTNVSETLGLWMEVQSTWMYLEAVFAGGDIMKQLPQEAKRFAQIDKQWVKIMTKAYEVKNVVGFCYNNELLNVLPFLRDQLEACQRQLSAYLEQKRNAFPRFYFVSDGVLLEILSQSSDPQAIQPHLVSIFDGLAHVTFERGKGIEKGLTKIVAMHSPELEEVKLREPVHAMGNVEDWLEKLEHEMCYTVKEILREGAQEVSGINGNLVSLKRFLEVYPAQIALLGLQLIWTHDVQNAISAPKSEQKKAVAECSKRINAIKHDLTEQTKQTLSYLKRTNVETLITIQVHQQEVWEQTVKRVRDPASFEWQKQVRFYWRQEKDTAIICIADTETEYCFEYLGCKERLVVTPLTDRCYITMSQSLQMYLGGAPAGPAGTGKTETVKDLGRTFGKYVVVFNCSDQLDFRAMAKIYKGLAQSGSWGCFDEFNRIDLPVLSVVAQQVATVLTAMKQHKTEFEFTDGQKCRLRHTTGFFITMNPGYAGRQELPENLKILFRGVSMMVPDRKSIMKVKLASSGYKEDALLSKKFFLLYGLCEQQLSKQRHYDFGLRNILSVLRTAGSVLRNSGNKDEEFLLMRTLRDMNLSKLVYEDVDLFISLINDMFPGKSSEKAHYEKLEEAIVRHVQKQRLVHHDEWVIKVIQLYETKLVRHGIMVVGPAGAGKTMIYNTMLACLSDIDRPHKDFRMNPKAITAPQMFGRLDHVSNDWHDGIFSFLWRKANKDKSKNIWIICDGPVDAIWIENLNTVLDDNKLLTLANGDRIQMSNSVKMCFEVENLANASPATVSRAGIIYTSSEDLGWAPVIKALLEAHPASDEELGPRSRFYFPEQFAAVLYPLYERYTFELHEFARRECKIIMTTTLAHLVANSYHLLNPLVEEAYRIHNKEVDSSLLEKLFWFSVAWAIGGTLEAEDRQRFDALLRKHMVGLPDDDTIFEYKVDIKQNQWKHWNEFITPWKYPGDEKLDFSTLFIPTLDSVRMHYLIDCNWQKKRPVLLMGGPGTAKTVTMETYLSGLDRRDDSELENFKWAKNNFSSATTPGIFQAALEDVIEKRMGSTYGPKRNSKLTLLIDDMNMPDINDWGDQTTNEIFRQVIEMSGLYSLDKVGEWKTIIDMQYMGAMSHPGGGRNDVPNRLKRHFNIFNMPLPSETALQQIYGVIFAGRFQAHDYPVEVCEVAERLTTMSITFWKKIQARMLPTPAKFHYFFNLRDLTRITQGIMMCPREVVVDDYLLTALWKHECTRVFSDKLNTVQDKVWFDKHIQIVIGEFLGEEMAAKTEHPEYFVNFLREPILDPDTGEELEPAPFVYEPIDNLPSLRDRIMNNMKLFNDASRSLKLDLVLFDAAVKHVTRISRTLAMPRGNALLVGVGGSGKQSLTRLASFIEGYRTFQITPTKSYNINNFFDDLRTQYIHAGTGKPVTFIFTDNEIKNESFLEYINNVLSSGEVPGLFPSEDKESLRNEIRPTAKKEKQREFQDTEDYLWKFFINKVRDNLHFVLCFSPVGDKFRTRARKFPGIISSTNINWFFPWPSAALLDVASKFLGEFNMETDQKVKNALMDLMANIHKIMTDVSTEYFQRFRRHVYSTPKSYLSFIDSYRKVYKDKYEYINSLAEKVNGGLKKLHQAGADVNTMKYQLSAKEVQLAEAAKETEILLVEITESAAKAEKKKGEVMAVKDVLAEEADKVARGKQEAEQDLAAAQPALEEARSALNAITTNDMKTLKAMPKPPEIVKRIFDGVCVLLHSPLNPVSWELIRGKPMIGDSWKLSGSLLVSRIDFIKLLTDFAENNKDEINEETCELLYPYLTMEDFNALRARQASGNVAGLCTWVRAMYTYHNIAKVVAPKIEALREAEGKLRVANARLQAKEDELRKVEFELEQCQKRLELAKNKKQTLQEDAERTKKRMTAANGLIDALSGERERWTQQSNEFQNLIKLLVGDCALACAFISYCGPFNAEFRHLLLNKYFYTDCTKRRIPVTENLAVTRFLIDEQQITDWNIEGLPTDDHSVQNGIMITRSIKYPLLVDPQGQGLQWLRTRLEPNNVVVTQLTARNFPDLLATCLCDGLPLIIENLGQEIDPMLNPVLEKTVVRTGRLLNIIINDKPHEYNEEFRLFMTTKLANPHFAPELYAKTTVVDFTVTMAGLEQQLLGRVISREKAELEEERAKLVEEVNANEKRLKYYEDRLLAQLSASEDNLIDDEDLIATLSDAKKASTEIKDKLSIAVDTRKRINSAREEYRPVAIRGSVLYFLIVEMSLVNPMYQTSLSQFLYLFDTGIERAEKHQITTKRIASIIETNTFSIFQYMSRGLFEVHKLLFVLLLACKIEMRGGALTNESFQCFLKAGAALNIAEVRPKPFPWIPDRAWLNILTLAENVKVFRNLPDLIQRAEPLWKYWWDQESPENTKVPELEERLDNFDRLLLVRCFREDRTMLAATNYVKEILGVRYAEPQTLDIEAVVQEAHTRMPIIFLLSQGSDPTGMIEALAKRMKKKISSISMGQGQEESANHIVVTAIMSGDWVLLQNCHLGLGFLALLEDILLKNEYEEANEECRIWITSEPNPNFPIGLLQMAIKLTNEPPQGIQAGLKRTYTWLTQDTLESFRRPEWRPLLYTVSFIHSIVQERRKFGPLGWNIPYEFNQGDWSASIQFLQNHLTTVGDDHRRGPVSWETIRYMIAEIQYGGRITDDKDRILFNTIAEVWLVPKIVQPEFQFLAGYAIPQHEEIVHHRKFIENNLPPVDNPEVFGLHPNADITFRTKQSQLILNTILDIQPRQSTTAGGATREDTVVKYADELMKKLPPDWRKDIIKDNMKRLGDKMPLNIFCAQEIDRLQVVISLIRKTLEDLKLAIAGTIIMSPHLQDALDSLYDSRLPPAWLKVSWPSPNMGLWFSDVLKRYDQLNSWLMGDRPNRYWLTGFFNPQGFLTSVKQEVTRAHSKENWSLDNVETKTEVQKWEKHETERAAPQEGVYIYGLFLEGCSWDKHKQKLKEASPKEMFKELPVLHVTAVESLASKALKGKGALNRYKCPCYKIPVRKDQNWIFDVDLPCEEDPNHWILRGVALLCTIE